MAAAFAANGDIKKAENHYLEALDILKNCGQIMDQAVTLARKGMVFIFALSVKTILLLF